MTRRYKLERDLSELEQMAERLQDYLLGDRLQLPLSVNYSRRSSAPELSLGAFLLRRRRLSCLRASMTAGQRRRLQGALGEHDAVQREWRLHYENKLKQEAPARLRQMRAFFRDCQENPAGCGGIYPPEALRRTIVQEIVSALDEMGCDKGEITDAVERTDHALRRLLRPGEFIWDACLEGVYPRLEFWWLYGSPA